MLIMVKFQGKKLDKYIIHLFKYRFIIQVISDNDYLNKDFIERVQKRGGEILNVRGKSSVFSAAKAVADHLKDWY